MNHKNAVFPLGKKIEGVTITKHPIEETGLLYKRV